MDNCLSVVNWPNWRRLLFLFVSSMLHTHPFLHNSLIREVQRNGLKIDATSLNSLFAKVNAALKHIVKEHPLHSPLPLPVPVPLPIEMVHKGTNRAQLISFHFI